MLKIYIKLNLSAQKKKYIEFNIQLILEQRHRNKISFISNSILTKQFYNIQYIEPTTDILQCQSWSSGTFSIVDLCNTSHQVQQTL
jgi:hypothetical protein